MIIFKIIRYKNFLSSGNSFTEIELNRNKSTLVGKRILITSGPTIESIDKVRFFANHSSGKQGHAIAAALAGRGANVTLVSGPVNEVPPGHVHLVPVTTATEMLTACTNAIAGQPIDIAICAAAVSDWRVTSAAPKKLKKPHDSRAKM